MASSAEAADLSGRRALVTGASRGIGRAVAQRLVAAGANVAMVARGREALEIAARELGGVAVPADVSEAAGIARVAGALRDALGDEPDIVVHAAGAFILAPVEETSPDAFDRILAVNLRGAFLLVHAFLPAMLVRRHGHIVTVGSIAGRVGLPGNAAYSASKFGVRGLHAVLDAELRGTGVRATLVEPAATDTELWQAVDRGRYPDVPPRTAMLDPAAVADAVLYALTRPPEVEVSSLMVERA